ncbi:MAG: CBS domain-containing protein [Anaerolineales bacterium]
MKNEYVKDWMTPQTITIHEEATLPDAHELMKEYGIRRLPVVDGNGKLKGIISQTDVREAQPSDATSLSIYELNYLLAKLRVKKVMTANVSTVMAESSVADAARIMLEQKIGGLPVVDDKGKLVGIITESDVFRMVVKLYAE